MARRRKFRFNRDSATTALTQIVTLVILLYVFDVILDAVWTTSSLNTSDWFSVAATLIQALLPVVGMIAAYKIIKRQLTV